jgi:hypothetical protein
VSPFVGKRENPGVVPTAVEVVAEEVSIWRQSRRSILSCRVGSECTQERLAENVELARTGMVVMEMILSFPCRRVRW